MRACTHSGVVMPRSGIASGQRVLRSIIVRRYVKPEEKGKGPTISMFMCENLFSGTEKCSSGVLYFRTLTVTTFFHPSTDLLPHPVPNKFV